MEVSSEQRLIRVHTICLRAVRIGSIPTGLPLGSLYCGEMLESMNVNDVDAAFLIFIVKKKNQIHFTALASSSGI